MEKGRWTDFLALKVQSQIQLENAQKMRTMILGFLSLIILGFSLNAIGRSNSRMFLQTSKVMFVLVYHAVTALVIYLPMLLQKGEKSLARFLGVRDFACLVLIASGLAFYSLVTLLLSYQIADAAKDLSSAGFLVVVSWFNFAFLLCYLAGFVAFFAGLLWAPAFLAKFNHFTTKSVPFLAGCHAVLFLLFGSNYTDNVKLGSPTCFEQFFVMTLFWVFISASLLLIGRLLYESALPALNSLEWDAVSGKIEKESEILERYKNAYTSARFFAWIERLSAQASIYAKDISRYTQESISLVSREKPTEIDLFQVEDRYKRAEGICKKLEKDGQRFQVSVSLMATHLLQQAKIEKLRDQYSRDSRNARLELVSVRKRIDEKLVAIRNAAIAEAAAMLPPVPPVPAEIPAVKELPVTK